MKKLTAGVKILVFLFVLVAAINAAAYPNLPVQVGMQIGIGGQMQNFLPKAIFIWLAPLLLCGAALLTRCAGTGQKNMIMVGAVIAVVNIAVILANLG